jgi:Ion channel
MIAAAIAVTILVALTILVHYEVLRLTSAVVPELAEIRPRGRVVLVVFACFAAHTIEVWLFAVAYFLFVNVLGLGSFGGTHQGAIVDYVYFSVVTYTSLGFGDVYPIGNVRLISGVEALVGLLMIGWSASFTYLAMVKFWPLHGPAKWRPFVPRRGQTPPPAS